MRKFPLPKDRLTPPSDTTCDRLDDVRIYLTSMGTEFVIQAVCYELFRHHSVERLDTMQRTALALRIQKTLAAAAIATDDRAAGVTIQ